jgi:hypothetical protein
MRSGSSGRSAAFSRRFDEAEQFRGGFHFVSERRERGGYLEEPRLGRPTVAQRVSSCIPRVFELSETKPQVRELPVGQKRHLCGRAKWAAKHFLGDVGRPFQIPGEYLDRAELGLTLRDDEIVVTERGGDGCGVLDVIPGFVMSTLAAAESGAIVQYARVEQ